VEHSQLLLLSLETSLHIRSTGRAARNECTDLIIEGQFTRTVHSKISQQDEKYRKTVTNKVRKCGYAERNRKIDLKFIFVSDQNRSNKPQLCCKKKAMCYSNPFVTL
jgi:hypothetical protein